MSKNSIFGAITKALSAMGLNAVPAVGFWGLGWGWENTLLIYLLETLIGGLLAALRIRLLAPAHEEVLGATIPNPWGKSKQIISYARPSYDGVRYERDEMLKTYGLIIVIFAVVLGAMVAGFLLLIMRVQLNLEALRTGLIGILMFQLLHLLGDIVWLRTLSLPESKKLLEQSVGRMGLVNLAILVGGFAASFHPYGFLLPFMALKTLMDVGQPVQALYQRWSQMRGVD